jgi:hypothetical protein
MLVYILSNVHVCPSKSPREMKRNTVPAIRHYVVGPVHGAVGVTENIPLYSSGYVQPATAVMPATVSDLSNQPLTGCVIVAGAAVKVGGGKVVTEPVAVYVGRSVMGTPMFDKLGGNVN